MSKVLSQRTARMYLKIFMLSERNKIQKSRYYVSLFTGNSRFKLIYNTEIRSILAWSMIGCKRSKESF